MFSTFSAVSLQSEQGVAGWDFCCCRFRRNARPDSTFTKKHFFMKCSFVETPGPLYPLGSPWVPLGCPWVSLGSPWVPCVFADSITLLLHLASRVPFGSPWVLFAFLLFPLDSPLVPLVTPWVPLAAKMSLLLNVFDVFF